MSGAGLLQARHVRIPIRKSLADGAAAASLAGATCGFATALSVAWRNGLSTLDAILLCAYFGAGYAAILIVPLLLASVFLGAASQRSPALAPHRARAIASVAAACVAVIHGLAWLHAEALPRHAGLVRLGGWLDIAFFAFVLACAGVAFAASGALREASARIGRRPAAWLATGALVATLAIALAMLVRSPARVTPSSPGPAALAHVPASEGPRLLVLACDGLSWKIAEPLVRSGRMPHVAALVNSGRGMLLSTKDAALTPVVWSSIATGQRRDVHGVDDFTRTRAWGLSRAYATLNVPGFVGVHRFEQVYESLGLFRCEPFNDTHRRVPALWDLAEACGRRAIVLGYPMTWPADSTSGTIMVTDKVFIPDLSRRAWPESILARIPGLRAAAAADSAGPFAPEREAATSLIGDRVRVALARDLLPGGGWGVSVVYLNLCDAAGHLYWGYHRPEDLITPPPLSERTRRGDLVETAYRLVDGHIGDLVEAAGPGTAVVLLSDHGMEAQPRLRWIGYRRMRDGGHTLAPPGVWIVSGLPFASRGVFGGEADVVDVLPTVLAALGLPLAEDLPGRVRDEMLSEEGIVAAASGPRVATFGGRRSPPPAEVSLEAERELRDRLRSLGYLN